MAERHSEFERETDDHYVEPSWCVERLLDCYPDLSALHDPCCGFGTMRSGFRSKPILIERAHNDRLGKR